MPAQHAFLCYDRADFALARRLCEELRQHGIPVWWDRDIRPGENWIYAVEHAIENCSAFLLCLSAQAVRRKKSGVYYEVSSAMKIWRLTKPGEIFVIPVLFSEFTIPAFEIGGTDPLRNVEPAKLFPSECWESELKSLVESLRKALEIPPGALTAEIPAPATPPVEDQFGLDSESQFLQVELKLSHAMPDRARDFSLKDAVERFLGLPSIEPSFPDNDRLVLRLPNEEAYRLLKFASVGNLADHGVLEARILAAPPSERSVEPPRDPARDDRSRSMPQARHEGVQAVVFTHFGALKYRKDGEEFTALRPEFTSRYKEIFSAYRACSTIVRVYAYIDWAFREAVLRIREDLSFNISTEVRAEEAEMINMLETAIRLAGCRPGMVKIIGYQHLEFLLHGLFKLDPDLIKFLCGPTGKFTYDSPKFVEAIIRLAWGDSPLLARHAILRIDEDALPNDNAIAVLVDRYGEEITRRRFFFFSGSYGDSGAEVEEIDYLNDFAVRTQWLAPIGATTARYRQSGSMQEGLTRRFLADLDALGPKQLHHSHRDYSRVLREICEKDIRQKRLERPGRQVISGAGLIMSSRSVRFLPPFMNFEHLTTWVDDHLKRRLHEALNDLGRNDVECIDTAKFKQVRHPKGLTSDDMRWAVREYFDRLIRGCVFRRIITNNDGTPTGYSKLVAEIVRFRVTGVPREGRFDERLDESGSGGEELLDVIRTKVEGTGTNLHVVREHVDLPSYREEMLSAARERYDEVLRCWSSDDYSGAGLGHAEDLHEWATQRYRANMARTPFFDPTDRLIPELLAPSLSVSKKELAIHLCERLPVLQPAGQTTARAWIERLNKELRDSDFSRFTDLPPGCGKRAEGAASRAAVDGKETKNREILQEVFPGAIPWWNHRDRTCQAVVEDALAYVRLLLNWHKFVRAVEQLSKFDVDWLYSPPEA